MNNVYRLSQDINVVFQMIHHLVQILCILETQIPNYTSVGKSFHKAQTKATTH